MDFETAMVEWEGRDHRVLVDGRMADGGCSHGRPTFCGDERPGVRRRRWPGRSVLRAGQLVSRWSFSDAVCDMDLRRAESDASHVSAHGDPGGPHSCVEVIRPGPESA